MPDKNTKVAFITGVTGQDGAYLSEILLSKGYVVHGLHRRVSVSNTERVDPLLPCGLVLHSGDMTDTGSLIRLVHDIQPDEIYNLAAQSHVHVSFDTPEYTANADGIGTLRILEAIRILGLKDKTRFFQASTSELFGKVVQSPQNETTPFYPRSPYAAAKLYAYWATVNYRESYGLYAVNGILFNHESPIRGSDFVTRKVTMSVARIFAGVQKCLFLGNLDARRDWGHARDYMKGVWSMLQQDVPEDFVLATGEMYTVREMVELAFAAAGIRIVWSGEGVDEVGVNADTGQVVVAVDRNYFRPAEVDMLCGDASKAKEKLGWTPEISFADLIGEMVQSDLKKVEEGNL